MAGRATAGDRASGSRGRGRGRLLGVAAVVVALCAWFVGVAAGPALAVTAHHEKSKSAKHASTERSKKPKEAKLPKHGKLTYYFVSHGCPTTTFWVNVWNAAENAGKQFGVNVKILKLTTAECTNVSAVVTLLDTAIAAHPDGIVTTVESPTAFSSALKTATHDGIPVVVMNTAPTNTGKPTAANPYLAYIGQDNYTAGVEAGTEAMKLFHLSKGDPVVIVDHEPTNISLTARDKGVEAAMNPAGIPTTVVNTSTTVSSGTSVLSSYLTTHKTVKAIMELGPTGAQQAVGALKADNLKGIPIGGFDLSSTVLSYIKRGLVGFTLDQQPYLQGYYSVEELFLKSTVGAAPVTIYTGPAFLTPKNVKKLAKFVTLTGY
jgi:simple sugar transport system substrate-binding protein